MGGLRARPSVTVPEPENLVAATSPWVHPPASALRTTGMAPDLTSRPEAVLIHGCHDCPVFPVAPRSIGHGQLLIRSSEEIGHWRSYRLRGGV